MRKERREVPVRQREMWRLPFRCCPGLEEERSSGCFVSASAKRQWRRRTWAVLVAEERTSAAHELGRGWVVELLVRTFINLDLHCPLGQPRTPCSSWALHTWHVTWLMRPTTDFLIVRNYHDIKFKLYMKIMFGFWKTFKYVQDNLSIWVYFSICIFCEI